MRVAAGLGCLLLACAPMGATAQSATHEDRTPDSPLEALLQYAVHSQSGQQRFEAAFMEQKVYVRITQQSFEALHAAQGPDGRLTARTQIELWSVTSETPSPLVPMFTSEAAFRRAYPEHPWLSISGQQALSLMAEPIAVRVSDGAGHIVTWSKSEVEVLKARYPAPTT